MMGEGKDIAKDRQDQALDKLIQSKQPKSLHHCSNTDHSISSRQDNLFICICSTKTLRNKFHHDIKIYAKVRTYIGNLGNVSVSGLYFDGHSSNSHDNHDNWLSCTAFLKLHAHCSQWLFSFKFDNLRDREIGKILIIQGDMQNL